MYLIGEIIGYMILIGIGIAIWYIFHFISELIGKNTLRWILIILVVIWIIALIGN